MSYTIYFRHVEFFLTHCHWKYISSAWCGENTDKLLHYIQLLHYKRKMNTFGDAQKHHHTEQEDYTSRHRKKESTAFDRLMH